MPGETRFEKILSLVQQSKYGIHDLSRIKSSRAGEFYRMNMPFELGLDIGCQRFKGSVWADKRCLILEAERYRYQAALSDLSNSDIMVHGNEPSLLIGEVRNWLCMQVDLDAPGPTFFRGRFFIGFMTDHYSRLISSGYSDKDIENCPIPDLVRDMKGWVRDNPWRV